MKYSHVILIWIICVMACAWQADHYQLKSEAAVWESLAARAVAVCERAVELYLLK